MKGDLLAIAACVRVATGEVIVAAFGQADAPEFVEGEIEDGQIVVAGGEHRAQGEFHLGAIDQVDGVDGPQGVDDFRWSDEQVALAQHATELDDVALEVGVRRDHLGIVRRGDHVGSAVWRCSWTSVPWRADS